MRCTKCHYLSFEPEPRCRNCGHDLSIDELALDVPMRASDSGDTLGEFDLDLDLGLMTNMHSSRATRESGSGRSDGNVATMTPPAAAPPPALTTELPLFVRDMVVVDEDLAPMVKVPERPRVPLGVRRTTPDPTRMRARYAPATHEPDLLDAVEDLTQVPVPPTPMHDEPVLHPTWDPEAFTDSTFAPIAAGARMAAALIDALVLGSIAAVVVVFTLRMAELPLAQVVVLPAMPMVAFLALIGLGYEWWFTAVNGQTIGKMAMGLRVVSDEHGDAEGVSIRQAALRSLSLLPLGVGLVAAFVGAGVAVHDRVAHTRVIRA
jgi:uncharacterized RDD family membrane protein YckC